MTDRSDRTVGCSGIVSYCLADCFDRSFDRAVGCSGIVSYCLAGSFDRSSDRAVGCLGMGVYCLAGSFDKCSDKVIQSNFETESAWGCMDSGYSGSLRQRTDTFSSGKDSAAMSENNCSGYSRSETDR